MASGQMTIRFLFAAFAAISASGAACEPAETHLYACVTTLITLHEDGGSSSQGPPKTADSFLLKIHPTKVPDPLWCEYGTNPQGFRRAYCQLSYQAELRGVSLYGENTSIFRGYLPWRYFALFDDNHFLWSEPAPNGVIISSGICNPD